MLEVKNLSFTVNVDGIEKNIIKNISFSISDEKLVAVTGPNGGGKSTLAKLLMGIETPTSGQIIFNGKDITNLPIFERAKLGMGFAFQQPVRFKGLQVLDLIRLAKGTSITVSDACEYLASVGLCARDYIDREINSSLSGGELKRIEIATLLAKSPMLSIFDEPEAGIDLWSFQNLIEVFRNMRANIKNSSILIISHQERILNIADEVIVIKSGEIAEMGEREKVLPKLIGTSSAVGACRKLA